MLKNLVGGSPRNERVGKSPRAAARKLRAVVESLEGRTMMSVAVMSVAVSGVAHRSIPIPAEVTTVTSSRVASNLASTAPTKTIPLNFDTPLLTEISDLLHKSSFKEEYYGRKALLLSNALVNYEHLLRTNTSKMTAIGWQDRDAGKTSFYYIDEKKAPPYFSNTFINNKINVKNAKADHYNYKTASPPEFWVDFANKKLGGGVFDTGFLQEETMFLETPELANAAAQPAAGQPALYTRTGGSAPLKGSPTPLIFMGANRVMDINSKWMTYSNTPDKRETENWRSKDVSVGDVLQHDVPLKTAQNINVLSMAAPLLPDTYKPSDSITKEDVKDLFNTFVAGFSLAKTVGGGNILINTGPIGAGGFHNNRIIVYVMQCLAAGQVGVDLTFWGYTKDNTGQYNMLVDQIINTAKSPTTISHLLDVASTELMKIK